MYCPEERESYFHRTINALKSSSLIEGIVQLGSGVIGYKDEHSDIDLMVSTNKITDVDEAKKYIQTYFSGLEFLYIKEVQFRENIFLLIAILENGLEFNVSILPTDYLNVKSPLWNVIEDKTGNVSEIMERENKNFTEREFKYFVSDDIGFDFFYAMRKFYTELKRQNLIYALKMLETSRDYILEVQGYNENKKLHQFKAYETLQPAFITRYLQTYPDEITVAKLLISADRLIDLFYDIVKQSDVFSVNEVWLDSVKVKDFMSKIDLRQFS
ncbi:hypothetical protein [Bacillus suaedaesalsae]|uniref:Nucleotidyltransferase domain-containing protein n=1 Tax=Bacillus suaedaesalsae TaxID=2810349 RepID=A0ABS2DMA9_9BACI|nr:hypothetical protein [Bacillus suaedaesalsae]MBM6619604.1 hypothetical protein [Bacillus suaedaesalsae]